MPVALPTTTSTPLLEMLGIEKSFGPARVLRSVNFDLRHGEVHVLAGENGAGKSTLMHILGGAHRADAGTVRIDGRSGTYLAAQAAGRADKVKFVGINSLPQEGIVYVKPGILDATFQYPTGGAEAIDAAFQILHGNRIPKEITLGSRVFTRDNVDSGGDPIG